MGRDIYTTTTGEIINNGNIVVSIAGWYYDTKTDDVKNTPTIAEISGKYDNDFTY